MAKTSKSVVKKPYITIQNVGPIKDITLPLNRVNVLIGPQSSGKSTIAKLLSFCSWLEKEMTITQKSIKTDEEYIKRNLFDYHRIGSYFDETSVVIYEDDCMKFSFSKMRATTKKCDNFAYSLSHKTAYIPAERIMAAIPNVRSFQLFHSSLQTFLFDWWKMGPIFTKDKAIEIPDTGVSYYYDPKTSSDVVRLPNGKELDLREASSGLQSLIPMYIYLKYVTEWVYEHEDVQSFDRSKTYDQALVRRIASTGNTPMSDDEIDEYIEAMKPTVSMEQMLQMARNYRAHGLKLPNMMEELAIFADNITHAHYTNIIIEEPELNLFPHTQIEFLYALLKMFKSDRDTMVITTHSPYLLFALNNCLMGGLVGSRIGEAQKKQMLSHEVWIDPKMVSVYELYDGELKPIQDGDGILLNNYLNKAHQQLASEYLAMLSYYESGK